MSTETVQFTKRAQRILTIAESEAQRLNHNYIGTEHLLLGMIAEKQGMAAKVLQELNVDLAEIKTAIEATVGRGKHSIQGKLALAPRTRHVLDLATYLAAQMGHIYIGTEHLIIAIGEEGEGMAAQILKRYVSLDEIITRVVEHIIESVRVSPTARKMNDDAIARVRQTLTSFEHEQTWSLSTAMTNILKLRRKRMVEQLSRVAAQEERNRLARDLHDSVKQQLFSISASAAAAKAHWQSDPEGAQQALADVQQNARAAMVEMDAMLQQLSPAPLATMEFMDALQQQAEALEYRTGAKVATEIGQLPGPERFPDRVQETLFRIVQEGFSNIARHARASNVYVRLEHVVEAETLTLEIRDDGQGFDVAQTMKGMGLSNLMSRAEELGGNVKLTSEKGSGTTVQVEIPLIWGKG
ncbi:MAG: Clp protease N-terminal domain-containing protein [Chloroflexota bacterium]